MKKLIINEEEKSRILSLHTNAIKKYLNEQDAPATPQPLVIPLGGTFESGQADIKNMAPIQDAKTKVSDFLSKLPQNQRISITIKAGESKVPNQPPYEEIGSLATARANELKAKLTSVLSDFGDKVVINPNIQITTGTTDWNPSLGKDNEVYRKEQYANAVVQAIGNTPPSISIPFCKGGKLYRRQVYYPGYSPMIGNNWKVDIQSHPNYGKDIELPKYTNNLILQCPTEGVTFFPLEDDFKAFKNDPQYNFTEETIGQLEYVNSATSFPTDLYGKALAAAGKGGKTVKDLPNLGMWYHPSALPLGGLNAREYLGVSNTEHTSN